MKFELRFINYDKICDMNVKHYKILASRKEIFTADEGREAEFIGQITMSLDWKPFGVCGGNMVFVNSKENATLEVICNSYGRENKEFCVKYDRYLGDGASKNLTIHSNAIAAGEDYDNEFKTITDKKFAAAMQNVVNTVNEIVGI